MFVKWDPDALKSHFLWLLSQNSHYKGLEPVRISPAESKKIDSQIEGQKYPAKLRIFA